MDTTPQACPYLWSDGLMVIEILVLSPRERAAGRAGPETDNLGDGAKRELLGQTGAPALGEQ